MSFYNETKKICRKCTIKKCKQCFGSIISHICISCIDGYYIPFDDKNRQNCKKCSENCIKCFGTKSFDICISCENWSVLKNGQCEKIKNVIKAIYNSTEN